MYSIVEQHKQESIRLCQKLIYEIKNNKEEAALFFGGEINRAYIVATEQALNKANNVLIKVRNI